MTKSTGARAAAQAKRHAAIQALTAEGHGIPAMAAHIGITPGKLHEWLDRNNPALLDRLARRYTDLDDIRHLASFGMNVDAIAHQLGIKPDSIKRRLQRRGEFALLDRIRTNHQPGRDIYRTRSAA